MAEGCSQRGIGRVIHPSTLPACEKGLQPLSKEELFFAGAGAGIVSKTLTAPLDRIRILFQVSPQRVFSVMAFLQTGVAIVERDGITALWRGNVAVVLRVIPYAGLQFATYERCRVEIGARWPHGGHDMKMRFVAGSLAGVTATAFTYPLDLLRARMAVSEGPCTSFGCTAESILRHEGPRGFFRGIAPTLFGIIPHAGMSFMVFETLKPWLQREVLGLRSQSEIPLVWRLAAGGVAGLVAQTAVYPLNVVRRRMQVQVLGCTDLAQPQYSSTARALAAIYATEGLAGGLYKGGSLTLVKGPVVTAISFAANDFLKQQIRFVRGTTEDRLPAGGQPIVPRGGFREQVGTAPRRTTAVEHLATGGVAGAVAKTVIAPGDRVKILFQTSEQRAFTWARVWKTFATILQNTGVSGLWRGHCATLMRVVPYSATSFMTFDLYRAQITELKVADDGVVRLLAGSLAGATATSLTYPLDLMRARMAAHWDLSPRYPSYSSAFQAVIRKEGPGALFHGLRPTLLGIVPYSGLSFMLFGTLKEQMAKRLELSSPDDLPSGTLLASGATAALLAQSVTYPVDIIRRRMQVGSNYRNEWHALTTIYTREGLVGGLFKGLSMNWLKGPIAAGISFTTNDLLKKRLSHE